MNRISADVPVLVAGGGIGGLAAALALTRQGLAVKVLEQAPQLGEIGAGIQLGPNGFAAFDALGIGCFAPTTAYLKFRKLVPDELIAPTMMTGYALASATGVARSKSGLTMLLNVERLVLDGGGAAAAEARA